MNALRKLLLASLAAALVQPASAASTDTRAFVTNAMASYAAAGHSDANGTWTVPAAGDVTATPASGTPAQIAFDLDEDDALRYAPASPSPDGLPASVSVTGAVFQVGYEEPAASVVADRQAAIALLKLDGDAAPAFYGWAGGMEVTDGGATTNLTWIKLVGAQSGATTNVVMDFDYASTPKTVTFKINGATLSDAVSGTTDAFPLATTQTKVNAVGFSGSGSFTGLGGSYDVQFYDVRFFDGATEYAQYAQQVEAGALASEPSPAPTKDGFSFDGWTNNLGTAWSFTTDTVEADTDLGAQWTASAVTITWNVEGTETTSSVAIGDTPSFAGTPTKAQDNTYTYQFAGWAASSGGEVLETIPVASVATTYYAVFTPTYRDYTITWNYVDPATGSSTSDETTVHWGAVPSHADPAGYVANNTIYAFDDWNVEPAAYDGTVTAYTATYTSTAAKATVFTVAGNGATTNVVGYYASLALAIHAADDGDTVVMLANETADATKTAAADRLVVTNAITIDFGAYTYSVPGSLEPTANWCALFIDADTVVKGTTGGIDCLDKDNPAGEVGVYAFNVREGATLTIEGGVYHGGGTVVQTQLGTTVINGGTFTATAFDEPYGMDFALNCVDAAYGAGTAGFAINGGTFVGFDPQDNKAEGAATDFTAAGYVAIDDGNGNFVVQAGWKVTFDANGGAPAPAAQRVAAGSLATEPSPAPAKANHSLRAWQTNGVDWVFTDAVPSDMTLVADWAIDQHTVIWIVDGQTPVTNKVDYGTSTSTIQPADPTKDADAQYTYTFAGWSPAPDATVTSNATYTAVFTETVKQYTVTFTWHDGSLADDYDYGTPSGDVTVPRNPPTYVENGTIYTFTGWSAEVPETITGDVTITAQYSSASAVATVFTVADNGATTNTVGTYATLAEAVAAATDGATVLLLDDVTLDARVEPNAGADTAITIDLGGNTIARTGTSGNGSVFDVKSGDVLITNGAIDCTQDDTAIAADGVYAITSRSGSNVTLADLTVTVDSECGACAYPFTGSTMTIESGTYANVTTVPYRYNTAITGMAVNQPNNATQNLVIKGGSFSQYDPQLGDDSGAMTDFTDDGYVAIQDGNGNWVVQPGWNVTFDANGGAPTPAPQRVAAGGTATAPTAPTKDHYSFRAWQLNNADYDFDTVLSADIGLVADWAIDTFTVTWVSEGATLKTDTGVPYGSTTNYVGTTPAKDADAQFTYEFAGWTTNGVDVTPASVEIVENTTFAAKFTATTNKYDVIWVADGSLVASNRVDYGTVTATLKPADPTKTGEGALYTFTGWGEIAETVTADATYTAAFKTWTKVAVPTGSDYTYDGTQKTGVAGGAGYTLSGDYAATAAGDYTATATLDDPDNTVWATDTAAPTATTNLTVSWSITPASIAITVAGTASTAVYTGEAQTTNVAWTASSEATGFDSSKVVYNGAASVSGTDVGPYAYGLAAAQFSYDDANYTATFTVTDAAFTITAATATIPAAAEGLVYSGSVQTGVAEGTGYTISGNTGTDAGSYTATLTLAANYQWSDGTSDATKTVSWSIAKAPLADLAVSLQGWTDGDAANAPSVTGNAGGGAETITYSADGETWSATQPTAPGTYTVKVEVPETANYLDGSATSTFTIDEIGTFTIIWLADDDTQIESTTVEANASPSHAAPAKTDATGKYAYAFAGWQDTTSGTVYPDALPAATAAATYRATYTTTIAVELGLPLANPAVDATVVGLAATVALAPTGTIAGVEYAASPDTATWTAGEGTLSFSDLDWNQGVAWSVSAAQGEGALAEAATNAGVFYAKASTEFFKASPQDFEAFGDMGAAGVGYSNAVSSAPGEAVRVHATIDVPADALETAPDVGTAKAGFAVLKLTGDAAAAFYAYDGETWSKLAGVEPAAGEADYLAVYDFAASPATVRYYIDGVPLRNATNGVFALPIGGMDSLSTIAFGSADMVKSDVVATQDVSYVAAVGPTAYTNGADAVAAIGTALASADTATVTLLKDGVDGSVSLGTGKSVTVVAGSYESGLDFAAANAPAEKVVETAGEPATTVTYSVEPNLATVIWLAEDGATEVGRTNAVVGTVPVYEGAAQTKAATDKALYTFSGWTNAAGVAYGPSDAFPAVAEGGTNYVATFKTWTKVARPTVASGLVYTGAEQTGVTVAAGSTATGTTAAANAGSYPVTVALDAEDSVWADATDPADAAARETVTADWSIARKAVTVTADDKGKIAGNADPELTATVAGTIGSDTVSYTLSRAAGETAGEYAITATGDATQGNYAVTFTGATFTISGAQAAVISVADAELGTTTTNYVDTLAAALAAAEDGDTVLLLENVTLDARLEPNPGADTAITIDLGGNTITREGTSGNGSVFDVKSGDVTITNGAIVCTQDDTAIAADGVYAITSRSGSNVTLADLDITVDSECGACAYPFSGSTMTIESGTYANLTTTPYRYNTAITGMAVNQPNNATQNLVIKGGSFSQYDPQLGDDSGAMTDFTDDGYVAIQDGNGNWVVQPGWNVTFDANGGAPTPDPQRIAAGDPATEPTGVAKANHSLRAWQTNGVDWVFTDAVPSDLTLVADWAIDQFDVIWVANGETVASNRVDWGTVTETLKPADPTKDGDDNALYTFTGWGEIDETVTADATYTASFKTWDKVAVPEAVTGLVYDGTEKTGVLAGAGYALSGNTATNAGDYTATVTLADPDNTVWATDTTAPTATTNKTVAWSIAPATMTITVAGYNGVYDGAAHAASATTVPAGATVTWSTDGGETWSDTVPSVTGVATVSVVAKAALANYADATATTSLVVTAKEITIAADDKTKVYDNDAATDPELTATVTGAIEGDAINYTLARAEGQDVADYTITVTAGENPNYTVATESGTFSITPATMTITVADYNGEYDGASHALEAIPSVAEGTTVEYKVGEGEWTSTAPSVKDVADSTAVQVRATNANYTTATTNVTMTVTAKAVTVAAVNKTKVYDNDATTDPELTATVTGAVEGETIAYELSREAGQAVANYAITVTVGENPNYTVTPEGAIFTITAATVQIPAAPGNKEYNGAAQTAGATATDTYSVVDAGGTNAGDYTVTYELTDKANYTWSDGSTTNQVFGWSITRKALTLTADNKEVAHGAAAPAYTYTSAGLVEGDSLATEPTLSCVYAAGDAVGPYTITIADAVAPNYAITYANGTLTVVSNTFTVIWLADDGTTEIDTTEVEWGETPTHADAIKASDGKYAYEFKAWTPAPGPVTEATNFVASFTRKIETPLALPLDPHTTDAVVAAAARTATVDLGPVGTIDGVTYTPSPAAAWDVNTATFSFADLAWNQATNWSVSAQQGADALAESAYNEGAFYAKPSVSWFTATTNQLEAVADASDAAVAYTNAVASNEGEMVRVHTKIAVPAGGLPAAPATGSAKVGFAVLQLENDTTPAYYAYGNGTWTKLSGVDPEAGDHDYLAVYDLAAAEPTARYYIDGVALYAAVDGGDDVYALPLAANVTSLSSISFASKEMVKDDIVAEQDVSYVAAVGQTAYTNILDAVAAQGKNEANTLALLKQNVGLADPVPLANTNQAFVVDYTLGSFTNENPVVSTATGYSVEKTVDAENEKLATYKLAAIEYPISYVLDLASATNAVANPTNYTVESAVAFLPAGAPGYTFNAWTNAAGATVSGWAAGESLGAVTNYASWQLLTYNIAYTLDGGATDPADANPATYTVESPAIALVNPAKTGYTFAGWTGTGLDAASTAVTIPAGSTGDRAYTATWTPALVDYTVKHLQQSVDGASYVEVEADRETKQGYTESQTEAVAKTYEGFQAGVFQQTEIAADGSTVVEIKYDRASFVLSIAYVYTNGTVAATQFTSNVVYGAAYSVDSPVIAGYTADQPSVSGTMGAAAVTVDVTYTVNRHTVTFVDEDGTTVLKAATEYDYGTPAGDIAKPDGPTKSATADWVFTFAGWKPAVADVTADAVYTATYASNATVATVITIVDNGDGTATTNETYFASLADALAAAGNGDTVRLDATVEEPAVALDKPITLDLNGNAWNVSAAEGGTTTNAIAVSAVVSIVDNGENGGGEINSAAEPAVTVAGGAALTVGENARIATPSSEPGTSVEVAAGGALVVDGAVDGGVEAGAGSAVSVTGEIWGDVSATGEGAAVAVNGGTVGGDVTVANGAGVSVTGEYANVVGGIAATGAGSEIAVSDGGTVTGDVVASSGAEATVSGGTVVGALAAQNGGSVEVASGSVSGGVTATGTGSTADVSGGEISGGMGAGVTVADGATGTISGDASVVDGVLATGAGSAVAVEGGSVSGGVSSADGAEATVSGGTVSDGLAANGGSIGVEGGTVNGTLSESNGGDLSATGGHFAEDPSEFVDTDEYQVTGDAVNGYDVTERTSLEGAVISIADLIYTGLGQEGVTNVAVNGANLVPVTDYTVAYANNTNAGVGTATATITGQGAWNGQIVTNFSIGKATLVATADDITVPYGTSPGLIDFTVTVTGFVNNETTNDLASLPVAACATYTVTTTEACEITVSGGEAANYEFSYVAGTLTVELTPPAVNPGQNLGEDDYANGDLPIEVTAANFVVKFRTYTPGVTYQLVASEDLTISDEQWRGVAASGNAVPVGDAVTSSATAAEGQVITLSAPMGDGAPNARFFKIRASVGSSSGNGGNEQP